jgi:hypothetical protein
MRLFSHCKGKPWSLRTGKPMKGQAVPVLRQNLPFFLSAGCYKKRVFSDKNLALRQPLSL